MIDQLEALLEARLAPGTPWREYELIQLARKEVPGFPQQPLSDTYHLFRCHFLLRHGLHRLKNQWRAAGLAELVLTPLYIERTDWQPGTWGLQCFDAVAEFYLDLTNLDRISRDDVTLLLQGFWDHYAARQAKAGLCQLLNLAPDTSDEALQRAWRKSALKLHPDKGGDIERFKQVQSAYDSWRRPRFISR